MQLLRSILFTVAFYGWTLVVCLGLLWVMFIPRKPMVRVITAYFRSLGWLERHILGLRYEVRGWEHVPTSGAFLVGAKHQSAWETLKLHVMFGDPAVVLKRELLFIPIWGWYAWKSGQIAVDRSKGRSAMESMVEGARRVVAEGRPIVIFPQGTRVPVGVYRPYKYGIIALYECLGVPIVPMALNSGLYWPKSGPKRGGTTIVEFLPPIPPGLSREEAQCRLEEVVEAASNRLAVAAGGPATPRPEPTTP